MTDHSLDLTPPLQALMALRGIQSLRELSRKSGVPRSQIAKIRQGQISQLPVASCQAVAKVLEISLLELLAQFGEQSENTSPMMPLNPDALKQQWQKESLDVIESLILQLPRAAFRAVDNPDFLAEHLLPLLSYLDRLLENWEVRPIGAIEEQVEFNPQLHQWNGKQTPPQPEDPVKITHVGYWHGDRLLHRAKVEPLA